MSDTHAPYPATSVFAASRAKDREGLGRAIEHAMTNAILQANAEGISTSEENSEEIRRRMMAARQKVKDAYAESMPPAEPELGLEHLEDVAEYVRLTKQVEMLKANRPSRLSDDLLAHTMEINKTTTAIKALEKKHGDDKLAAVHSAALWIADNIKRGIGTEADYAYFSELKLTMARALLTA